MIVLCKLSLRLKSTIHPLQCVRVIGMCMALAGEVGRFDVRYPDNWPGTSRRSRPK